jgi:hypothetical protein
LRNFAKAFVKEVIFVSTTTQNTFIIRPEKAKRLPVIMTSGSAVDCPDDCDVWSDSKGCGIGWGGKRWGEINGPAG